MADDLSPGWAATELRRLREREREVAMTIERLREREREAERLLRQVGGISTAPPQRWDADVARWLATREGQK